MAADFERHFLLMGAEAHLRILGPDADALLGWAEARLAELEARWSRFVPSSDVCRMNAGCGEAVQVAPETVGLVELALSGWVLTEGRFDPSVLPALVAAGYDRSFTLLEARGPVARGDAQPVPGCAGVRVDHEAGTVLVPDGVQLDLGGIGKGHGADLIASELMAFGAIGACVNLGGDVRVTGQGPGAGGWTVGVEHPLQPEHIATIVIADGAVATSTIARRRWGDGAHHLIDPSTGRPASSDLLAVTVVGAEAAWAEVIAKAALLAGFEAAPGLVADLGLTGVLVDADGVVWMLPGLEDLLA